MYDVPALVWVVVLAGAIGIPAWTCVELYRGAQGAGLGRRPAALVSGGAAVLLGGWLAVSALLADRLVYHQNPGQTKPWLAVALLGVLGTLLAATRIPLVARVLAAPGTTARLILPHTLRLAGASFLIVMALGHLPAIFAVPAGLGDIAIGLAAPPVAGALARGAHRPAFWFNVLGLLDLVVAVGIGVTVGYRIVEVTPSGEPLSLLPLALIPTTAVPLLLALHIVSLRQLATAARTAAAPPGQHSAGSPAAVDLADRRARQAGNHRR
jgi:hypothetical protein